MISFILKGFRLFLEVAEKFIEGNV